MVSALWERAAAPGTGGARASAHLCPGHSPRNQFPESETGEGLAKRLTEDPREKRWLGLQTKAPQSKGHISQAVEGSPGTGNKVRHEAGSGGGPRPGRVRELPSGILWNGQPPPPSVPSPSWLRMASPKSLAWTVAPPRAGLPLSPVGAGEGGSPGVRRSGGAGWPPRGPSRPLPTPGRSLAGARPGPPATRPPAHGARALGPGSLGSRHLFSAPFAVAAAATGRRVRAGGHARREHARGGWTGRGTGIHPGPSQAPEVTGTRGHCSAHGWRPVTPEARPSPPRCPTALPQRTHPGTGVRALGHPGAQASCNCSGGRRGSADNQTKRQLLGPFTISQRWVFVTCLWAPSPTRPHVPTHPHVPAPTGRAGCKPALLLGPPRSQTHTEGHNRSASPRHVKNPPQAGTLAGAGVAPPTGFLRVGPEALATGLASCPAPPRPSLLCLVSLPPCRALPSQPASTSGWIGLCCTVSQQAGCGTLFEAVRQWSSPCHSSASPLLERPPPRECGPNGLKCEVDSEPSWVSCLSPRGGSFSWDGKLPPPAGHLLIPSYLDLFFLFPSLHT